MTTGTAIALPVADSWGIYIGGGWILVMAIGMAFCFVSMLAFMWLMRDGRGWPMCGMRWWQEPAPRLGGRDDPHPDALVGAVTRSGPGARSPVSEARR